jgi:hypothetical protein
VALFLNLCYPFPCLSRTTMPKAYINSTSKSYSVSHYILSPSRSGIKVPTHCSSRISAEAILSVSWLDLVVRPAWSLRIDCMNWKANARRFRGGVEGLEVWGIWKGLARGRYARMALDDIA